jgi:hypothetical protein
VRDAATLTKELIAGGLSQPQTTLLMELVLVLSGGNSTRQPVESPAMQRAEKRRAWDRERKRKVKSLSANSTGIPLESSGIPPETAENPCILKGSKEAFQVEVKEKKESKKGSRLLKEARASEADFAFALSTGIPPEKVDEEWAEFVDYWIGVPGSRGCKLNWPATWRNRVRQIAKKYSGRGTAKPLTEFQRKQAETNDVRANLRDLANSGRSGGTPDRFLSIDHGERPEGVRGGLGAGILALPRASGRTGG